MSVYDTKSLKDGISALDNEYVQNGSDDLYNRGYNLEIEHVPSGYKVKFPAYLDNFSDAFTQSWNAEDVYGRMDPIAVYQNTRRAIAMSWHIPAGSPERAKENMNVVNALMTFMYPSYSKQKGGGGSVLNMSPLLRIKFLNLVHNAANPDQGLLGYANGFTVDIRSEDGMFMSDAGDADPEKTKGTAVYPKTLTLNIELNVLHEHEMGWTIGPDGDMMLRQAKDGYPYRTDQQVPSKDNSVPPLVPIPPPKDNTANAGAEAGAGEAQVLSNAWPPSIIRPRR